MRCRTLVEDFFAMGFAMGHSAAVELEARDDEKKTEDALERRGVNAAAAAADVGFEFLYELCHELHRNRLLGAERAQRRHEVIDGEGWGRPTVAAIALGPLLLRALPSLQQQLDELLPHAALEALRVQEVLEAHVGRRELRGNERL